MNKNLNRKEMIFNLKFKKNVTNFKTKLMKSIFKKDIIVKTEKIFEKLNLEEINLTNFISEEDAQNIGSLLPALG